MSDGPAKPVAIIFDWDNTLVDTWTTIHEALQFTFEAMGHEPWTRDETQSRVRQSLREAFPGLFGDRWEEAREIFFARFENIHIKRLKPLSDAEPLLLTLADADIGLCVVSNKTGRYLRAEAAHLGWQGYFLSLIGAGDAERDKPAPEAVFAALAGTEIEPGPEVWFVGDTNVDMEIAHRAGCVPILLHRKPDDPEFRDWPPTHCFTSCGELLNCIAGW